MKSIANLVVFVALAGAGVRAADAASDAEKIRQYEDRVKTLEERVHELEAKLNENSPRSRLLPPGQMVPPNAFTRDRFDKMMEVMRREMETDGVFGFGPGLDPRLGVPGMRAPRNKMRLGVMLEKSSPELSAQFHNEVQEGAFVMNVMPGSPAEKAGLMVGDAITSFDTKTVSGPQDIIESVKAAAKGQHELIVNRRGQPLTLKVELGAEVAASGDNLRLDDNAFIDDRTTLALPRNGNAKVHTEIKVSALELNAQVAREMKLTDDEQKKVSDVLAKHARAVSDEFTAKNAGGHAAAFNADVNELARKHADEAAAELAQLLKPEQMKTWNDYRHSHNSISFSQSMITEGGKGDISNTGPGTNF